MAKGKQSKLWSHFVYLHEDIVIDGVVRVTRCKAGGGLRGYHSRAN